MQFHHTQRFSLVSFFIFPCKFSCLSQFQVEFGHSACLPRRRLLWLNCSKIDPTYQQQLPPQQQQQHVQQFRQTQVFSTRYRNLSQQLKAVWKAAAAAAGARSAAGDLYAWIAQRISRCNTLQDFSIMLYIRRYRLLYYLINLGQISSLKKMIFNCHARCNSGLQQPDNKACVQGRHGPYPVAYCILIARRIGYVNIPVDRIRRLSR